MIDRGLLIGSSISPIRYKVDGATGNRILKIEWKNAGFYEELEANLTLNDFVNVQCWIYESDGCIEYRMGPTVAAPTSYYGSDGPVIGLGYFDNASEFFDWGYYLIGQAGNPNIINDFEPMSNTPTDGTVYRFCPSPIVVSSKDVELNKTTFEVIPNPAEDIIQLALNGLSASNVQVYNMMGQEMAITEINSNSSISIAHLNAGLYLIQVETEEGILSQKFIKQ